MSINKSTIASNEVHTDIAIIGAGPCGLFTVFEAGLLNLKCHLIDSLAVAGGQLAEIYPKKPIYDIPGYPEILAGDLIQNLLKQIEPFKPTFSLGETAIEFSKSEDGFTIITDAGSRINSKVIAIAAGLGSFEPRKPEVENLEKYEKNGVDYIIKDPEKYRHKKVVIAGGGDSALDWAIFLSDLTSELTLIHRRTEFRAAPESVSKVFNLSNQGKIKLLLNTEIKKLIGEAQLEGITVSVENHERKINSDYFIPLFGLTPKLGPIANWGLELDKNAIVVNTFDYCSNIPGIFAIGDVNTYPGKLKLILCGFHEATLMVQSAYKIIHSGKKPSFKYTTVTGIEAFK